VLAAIYHLPGVDISDFKAAAMDLVDWMSSYFPLEYKPPASAMVGDQPAITRQALVSGLSGLGP
jgi:hypothetical protein